MTSDFREVIVMVDDVQDHGARAGQPHFVPIVFGFD